MNVPLKLLGTTGAALIVAALCRTPAAAFAAPTSPIEILACTPVYDVRDTNPYALGFLDRVGTEIQFVNHAAVDARRVDFRLGDNANATTVVGNGRFSPGAKIRVVLDATPAEHSSCSVAKIRFADDTAYDASLPLTAQY